MKANQIKYNYQNPLVTVNKTVINEIMRKQFNKNE